MHWLRTGPYRLLFPWGLVLATVGVLPWTLIALGLVEDYPAAEHAMALVQGFLTAMAAGFLMTMLPRRTATAHPHAVEPSLVALGTGVAALCALTHHLVAAQLGWMLALATLTRFVLTRLHPRGPDAAGSREAPGAFVWLEVALLFGWVGAVAAGVGGALADSLWAWHQLGRALVLQGFFLALVMGVGSMAIPLMTGSGTAMPRWSQSRSFHLAMASVLAAGFWVEARGQVQVGYALRALSVFAVLGLGYGAYRLPIKRGLLRWMIWFSMWLLASGLAAVALLGDSQKSLLHLSYIGGMGTMAFAVAGQVVMGHAGAEAARDASPVFVRVTAVFLLVALGCRLSVRFFPESFYALTGLGSVMFGLAALTILGGLGPYFRPRP